jgi:hypothetical protein
VLHAHGCCMVPATKRVGARRARVRPPLPARRVRRSLLCASRRPPPYLNGRLSTGTNVRPEGFRGSAPSVMPHHPAARTRIFGCRTRAAPPRGTLGPPGPTGRPRYRPRPGSHPADLSSKRPRLGALLLPRSLLVLFRHHDRHDNSIGGSTMNQDRAYPSSTTTCRPRPAAVDVLSGHPRGSRRRIYAR